MVSIGLSSIRFEVSEQNVSKSGWTVLFVDAEGAGASDSNDGYSWGQAKKTIGGALADAKSWCKIYIRAGTYNEDVEVPYEHIQLIGEAMDGPSAVLITTTGGTGITMTGGFCEVSDLIVMAEDGHGIIATNPGQHIHDCLISLTNSTGLNINGIWLHDCDRCEINDNMITGGNDAEVIGIMIGEETVDANIHNNMISDCGDGIGGLGCVAGVCTNNGYGIGIDDDAQRANIHDNYIIDNCVGIYLYNTLGEEYKGHTIIHNQFYENCNFDVYDQFDPDDVGNPSGILIRENFYGYLGGWYSDFNRDGRADYMIDCNTNKDYAPLASPRSWETEGTPRSDRI